LGKCYCLFLLGERKRRREESEGGTERKGNKREKGEIHYSKKVLSRQCNLKIKKELAILGYVRVGGCVGGWVCRCVSLFLLYIWQKGSLYSFQSMDSTPKP
jgi:hypothetical protein